MTRVAVRVSGTIPAIEPLLIPVFADAAGLTQKSLQRLFPCDTSMVVIIDDRADVWEWSPNLLKVIPCALYFSGYLSAVELY